MVAKKELHQNLDGVESVSSDKWRMPTLTLLNLGQSVSNSSNTLESTLNSPYLHHTRTNSDFSTVNTILEQSYSHPDSDQSHLIEQTFKRLGVEVTVQEVNAGPTITQYALEPGPKVKVKRIAELADDLALALAVPSVRLELPVPGKALVGLEVPNRHRHTVGLVELLASPSFEQYQGQLKLALGRAVDGQPVVADLATMPHLLIGGSTGAGKSVFLNALVATLLLQYTPDEVQLVMIDPKLVELTPYNGIPHLLFPVITKILPTPIPALATSESGPNENTIERNRENEVLNHTSKSLNFAPVELDAVSVLAWAIGELERRKQLLSQARQRNIQSYNKAVASQVLVKEGQGQGQEQGQATSLPGRVGSRVGQLPYLIIIIDELANLMLTTPRETEVAIVRLAQEARAFGIHLVVATQRPSVDIVTGLIKANLPARVSFAVSSQGDSRVILDTVGAEKLLGRGDMLYDDAASGGKPRRVQGVYVSDAELDRLIEWWQTQAQTQKLSGSISSPPTSTLTSFYPASSTGDSNQSQNTSLGVGANVQNLSRNLGVKEQHPKNDRNATIRPGRSSVPSLVVIANPPPPPVTASTMISPPSILPVAVDSSIITEATNNTVAFDSTAGSLSDSSFATPVVGESNVEVSKSNPDKKSSLDKSMATLTSTQTQTEVELNELRETVKQVQQQLTEQNHQIKELREVVLQLQTYFYSKSSKDARLPSAGLSEDTLKTSSGRSRHEARFEDTDPLVKEDESTKAQVAKSNPHDRVILEDRQLDNNAPDPFGFVKPAAHLYLDTMHVKQLVTSHNEDIGQDYVSSSDLVGSDIHIPENKAQLQTHLPELLSTSPTIRASKLDNAVAFNSAEMPPASRMDEGKVPSSSSTDLKNENRTRQPLADAASSNVEVVPTKSVHTSTPTPTSADGNATDTKGVGRGLPPLRKELSIGEQRSFNRVTLQLRKMSRQHLEILSFLADREDDQVELNLGSLAAFLGYKALTFYRNPPIALVEMGLLSRSAPNREAKYWSTLSNFAKQMFPGVESAVVVKTIHEILQAKLK